MRHSTYKSESFLLLYCELNLGGIRVSNDVFGSIERLLLQVGEAFRLTHDKEYKQQAEEGQASEVPDRSVDFQAAVDHVLQRQ